ncbi:MAG: ABC transporter permease [Bifidobacteriaceae bacterium]|jgi:NitT/TauT family transport system permease protein|nr:ABC transporter permease [Bifidobacteriaceae bacterium]
MSAPAAPALRRKPDANPKNGGPAPAGRAPWTARLRKRAKNLALPVVTTVVLLAFWEYFSTQIMSPARRFILPPPSDVVRIGFLDDRNRGELLAGLSQTASVAVVGLAIAIVLGSLVALAMSQAIWLERSIYPWAVILQTIPILALVPLISFWFGYGFGSRVLVCVMIALFPIITNTLFGLQSATEAHRDLFRLYGASWRDKVLKLLIPGALPSVLAGWRISAGLSVTGAIVGDYFFRHGQAGIGRLLDAYTQHLRSAQLFAGVILASSFGIAVFWAFGLLSQAVVGKWHETGRRAGAGREA